MTPLGTLALWAGGITGRPGTEEDTVESGPLAATENATVALAGRGVRASVIRLSPVVHSTLDTQGFAPALIGIAREKGVAAYVGDGANRWPAVHTLDAARLFLLALESAPAARGCTAWPRRACRSVSSPERSAATSACPRPASLPEDAAGHFGFLGMFAAADNPASSALTRQWLGWAPACPGLIADLDAGHYFAQPEK